MIFFSDAYQKSPNCQLEAQSAKRHGKMLVFVKVQKNDCTIDAWFEPIIGNAVYSVTDQTRTQEKRVSCLLQDYKITRMI